MLLLLWISITPTYIVEYDVDVIELNKVLRRDPETGVHEVTFTQLIFWDWKPLRGEFIVRDWRKWSAGKPLPVYDRRRRCWVLLLRDGKKWKMIRANSFSQTLTDFDPELLDRKTNPPPRRRGL